MEVESAAVANNPDEHLVPLPFPGARRGRVLYGLFVIVLPIFCFWGIQLNKPDWQSGELRAYINLLLVPEASLLFFPLLIYSVSSYILLLISPFRFACSFLIRAGIYSGVLLALQYSLLTLFVLTPLPFNLLVIVTGLSPLMLSRLSPWAIRKWGVKFPGVFLASVIVASYLIGALITSELAGTLLLLVIFFALVSPFWSLLLSGRAAVWLIKNFESQITVLRGVGVAAWFVGYAAAWRFDILKMFELYSALPTEPPCYIATAAAQGHPHFVRLREVRLANGQSMRVNAQLQRLKFAELALKAISPRFHKTLRRVYDVLGKTLAQRIQHPILADAAYLLLKPFEWISIYLLSNLLQEADQIASKIYIDA